MTAHDRIWNVVIIGGGIIGLATALELQSRGYEVVVIDRGRPRERASFGNAGVIGNASVLTPAGPGVWRKLLRYAVNNDPSLRIRYRSLPKTGRWLLCFLANCRRSVWRRSAKALYPLTAVGYDNHLQLAQLVGGTALIKRSGYLKLFRRFPGDATAQLERQILDEMGIRALLLDAASLRDLEPCLSGPFTHGLFFPESGSVASPGKLLELCWKAFRQRNGCVVAGEAQGIGYDQQQITIMVDGARIVAQRAVIAAGVWSARLIAPLGYRVPLAAERGYHVQLELRQGASLTRPIFDSDGGYVAAPVEDGVRVLTGIEIATPEDPPELSQLHAVLEMARCRLPLAQVTDPSYWLGSRPAMADGLPVIGEAVRHRKLFFAFGHGHIGLATGPATGRIIADLISGVLPQVAIAPFAIERFG